MTNAGSNERFAQRTFSNMATEVAYVLVAVLNGLFMVPYFKDELGLAAYAIIPLATSVTSYVTIMSDSFSEAVNRYFIMSLRNGDKEDSVLTYNTSIRAMLKFCVIVLPIMAVVAYITPYVFNIGDSSVLDVQLMFLATLWSTMVFAVGTCFNNTFVAENKMTIINSLRILYLLSQITIIVLLFAIDSPSLIYIGLAYMAASLLYAGLSFIFMKRNYPFLQVRRGMNDKGRLRKIGNLGGWSIINKLGDMFFLQASLIITNLFLGVEAEGHLSFATTMVSICGTSCIMFSNVFTPHFYDAYASNDMHRLSQLARVGVTFLGTVLALPLAFVSVFAPEILTAWVGESEAFMGEIVQVMFFILILHYSLYVLTPIPTISLNARPAALQVLFCGIINIVLALIVVMYTDWGLMGVAFSWVAAMLIRSMIAFPTLNARILKMPLRELITPQWKSAALFIICLLVLFALSKVVVMPTTLLVIAPVFLVIFAIYLIPALRVMFTKAERQELMRFMPEKVARILGRLLC